MFQHQFQNGACVEVFSAQEKSPLAHWNVAGIKKLFDKEVKSFVYVLEGTAEKSKMQLPKDIKRGLALMQSFLMLQVYVPTSKDLSLDLSVAEKDEERRRLALSTVYRETRVNPLHCQIPIGFIRRAMWLNLCIDMRSLVTEAWSDATFSSLEGITVTGSCRLRRIFTMKRQAPDTTDDDDVYGIEVNTDVELESIPKHCLLPTEVRQLTQVANWLKVQQFESKSPHSASMSSTAGSANKTTSSHSSTEPKTADEKQHHSKHQTEIKQESLHSSHTATDGKESVPFVHPHPPQKPSSKPTRRKPRVKSAENDRTTSANDTSCGDGGALRPSEMSVRADVVSSDAEVDKITRAVRKKSFSASEPKSRELHDASGQSDESISDVINALKDNNLNFKHSDDDSRVYTFSSPPTVVAAPRLYVSPPSSADALQRLSPDTPLQPDSTTDDGRSENELDSGQITAVSVSPVRLDSDNGATDSRLSPMLQSVRRSSLREIPEDEIRRSGGAKPYISTKYQAADDELSQSFEQQMLLEMKRDEETDEMNSMKHSGRLLSSQLRFGEDPHSDSSDDDTSTFKSPKYFPKHRPSYDYQEEIANLGRRFLASSNAGEWESPRIVSPFATLNSSRDVDTMEIPRVSTLRMSAQSTNVHAQTNQSAVHSQADEELDLLYDPQLQCFYDPVTCKYYKLL